MRLHARLATAALSGAVLLGCGSASWVEAPPSHAPDVADAGMEEDAARVESTVDAPVDTGERSRPQSTTSYEDAIARPEAIDLHDDRAQLTDIQLRNPMGAVINACRLPRNAKVTVKTAVQNGRAIGVTVDVRFERPKSKKPPTRATLKAQAKLSAKIVACVDRAVRAQTWPPSARRDSFVTEF